VRWEANRAENERQCAQKRNEWLKGAAWAAAKARGGGGVGETPFKSESSGDDE
jgi:hypothetical protein